MKTTKGHQIEIIFVAFVSGLVGVSIGYYWAAATAAERVREVLGQ